MFKQYQFRNYRIKLIILVYLLTTIGILVIGSAEKGYQSQQILGLVLGSAAMLVCSLTDYNILMHLHWPVYIFIADHRINTSWKRGKWRTAMDRPESFLASAIRACQDFADAFLCKILFRQTGSHQ